MSTIPFVVFNGMDLRGVVVAEILLCDKVALVFVAVLVVLVIFVVGAEQFGDAWVDSMLDIVIVECSLVRAVDVSEDEFVAELWLQLQESHEYHAGSPPHLRVRVLHRFCQVNLEVFSISVHEVAVRSSRVPQQYEEQILCAVHADLLPLIAGLLEDCVDYSIMKQMRFLRMNSYDEAKECKCHKGCYLLVAFGLGEDAQEARVRLLGHHAIGDLHQLE